MEINMSDTEPYRPSNGSEGESFYEGWCAHCEHDRCEDNPCEILGRTLALDADHPDYPAAWVRDVGDWPGNPRCTAFVPLVGAPPSIIPDTRQMSLLELMI